MPLKVEFYSSASEFVTLTVLLALFYHKTFFHKKTENGTVFGYGAAVFEDPETVQRTVRVKNSDALL